LLSLKSTERDYLRLNGINLFQLILNTFMRIEPNQAPQIEQIATLRRELSQILDSTSWKITKPLRALKLYLMKLLGP